MSEEEEAVFKDHGAVGTWLTNLNERHRIITANGIIVEEGESTSRHFQQPSSCYLHEGVIIEDEAHRKRPGGYDQSCRSGY